MIEQCNSVKQNTSVTAAVTGHQNSIMNALKEQPFTHTIRTLCLAVMLNEPQTVKPAVTDLGL